MQGAAPHPTKGPVLWKPVTCNRAERDGNTPLGSLIAQEHRETQEKPPRSRNERGGFLFLIGSPPSGSLRT